MVKKLLVKESDIGLKETLTDKQIKIILSYLLYDISDNGLQQVIRAMVFDNASGINWQKVLDNIYKYMPEIKKYKTFDDFIADRII